MILPRQRCDVAAEQVGAELFKTFALRLGLPGVKSAPGALEANDEDIAAHFDLKSLGK
jgi:hypothetical protein